MKRCISLTLLIIICFVLQTSVFTHIRLSHIMPNLLVILTSAAGFMYGRKYGMFVGIICGLLIDLIYGEIIGVSIFIFVIIGYVNGLSNKLYFKDDLSIPLFAVAVSDLLYGLLYYICHYLLRGRFDILFYIIHIMIPEMIYTVAVGIIIYKVLQWLEDRLYPEQEVPLSKGDKSY